MKRLTHIVTFILVCGGLVAVGAAQQVATTKPLSVADHYIGMVDPIVSLTDEQKATIREIVDGREQFSREFLAKNREAMEKINAETAKAYQRQDMDAVQRCQEKFDKLNAPLMEYQRKANERLERVLTHQQKLKLEDHQITQWIKQMASPVELTASQMKAVKAAAMADGGSDRYLQAQQALLEILTPQQKGQISRTHAMQWVKTVFYDIGVSDEQWKKAEQACDAIVKDASLDQSAINGMLREKIAAMLTPEQSEKYKKRYKSN